MVFHLFIENAAAQLNASVEFIAPPFRNREEAAINFKSGKTPKYFLAIANELMQWTTTEYSITQIRLSTIRSQFLYCVKKNEREAFSFMFWVIPYDFTS